MSVSAAPSPSRFKYLAGRYFARRVVLLATLILLAVIVAAASVSWISNVDPSAVSIMQRLKAPSWSNWAGTDQLGRDVFLRMAYGGRYSLTIGAVTAIGAVVIGTALGIAAGYFRWADAPIMRVVDAMMAFPDILLGIALVAILGPSLWNVVLALVIVYTPRVARVARASTLVLRDLLYVDAARAIGTPTWKILYLHILPGLVSPILVQLTFIFAYAILAEAGLSFLGVGVPPSIPTWGTMIVGSLNYSDQAFWTIIYPGLAIVMTSLSLQIVGDGIRDSLDPKLRIAV
ncbi:ABC transporter permease [Pollutimonas bauzanensis]|uniref:Peptide/nickel transport system permease protein n=1 Tax=Pollutimonas bauzanensis TaxID=658167 RepID=A0A1M5M4K7_9BURK|nr:ABC transporter permease [Pollutimonas bauzanensis]SHG72244.1 peptide/nickel transport system permease protein [Pollutimonas bauzanensis]